MYSYGGVGTRMLYEWLKPFYSDIIDQGGVHYKVPDFQSMTSEDHVIYLYGDPVDAVLSFFGKDMKDGNFIKQHCGNLQVPPVTTSIQDYINNGQDAFGLFNHFVKYRNILLDDTPREQKIIFIHYDALWNDTDEFLSYINLLYKKRDFPAKRKRTEKPWVTKEIRDGLEDIYSDMKKKMSELPKLVCR